MGDCMKNKKYRWLHLSDIHIANDASQQSMQKKMLLEIENAIGDNPVDSIIITGDFFYRGALEVDNSQLKAFLKALYKSCAEKGEWAEFVDEPSKMQRVFYCNGNHDFDRMVSDGSKHLKREKELKKLLSEFPNQLPNSMNSYELMTYKTFKAFDNKMFELLNNDEYVSSFPQEYKIFYLNKDTPHPVIFVGINTELYAGQVMTGEELKKRMKESFSAFNKYHESLEFSLASKEYDTFARSFNELIKGGSAKDDGKLCCISQNAINTIEKELKEISGENVPLVIFFGHRPLTSLTFEAQERFDNLADYSEPSVYLCGHSHRPQFSILPVSHIQNEIHNQFQISNGGAFADASNYNKCSFSIGTIEWAENDNPLLSVDIYIWTSVFGTYSDQIKGQNEVYRWIKINVINKKELCMQKKISLNV